MSVMEMPAAPAGTLAQQVQQQYTYLFRLAQALNRAMEQVEGTAGAQAVQAQRAKDSSRDAREERARQAATLKSLIIKSADVVRQEMDRLAECGIEDYTGRYTVTGPPKGYRIEAMDSDEYMGFVYAMTSEKENTVTYVMIHFCNYFLDLDIHEYVPDEYLLEGFDATQDNPYREQIHAEKQK